MVRLVQVFGLTDVSVLFQRGRNTMLDLDLVSTLAAVKGEMSGRTSLQY